MPISTGGSQGLRRKKRVSMPGAVQGNEEEALLESERQMRALSQAGSSPGGNPWPRIPMHDLSQSPPPDVQRNPEYFSPTGAMSSPKEEAFAPQEPLPNVPMPAPPSRGGLGMEQIQNQYMPASPSLQATPNWGDTVPRPSGDRAEGSYSGEGQGDEPFAKAERRAMAKKFGSSGDLKDLQAKAGPGSFATGVEPFEEAAFNESQGSQRNWLEAMRGVAEGLGNIEFTSPGHIRQGLSGTRHGKEPYVAEGIRREMMRNEDRIRPRERDVMANRWGWDPGEDAPFSRSMDVAQQLSRGAGSEAELVKQAMIQARFDESVKRRDRGLDLSETKEGRLQGAEERAEWNARKLPNASDKENISLLNTEKLANELENYYEPIKQKIGPIWSTLRGSALSRRLGVDDPEITNLNRQIIDVLGAYLTAQTGAQRGMVEVAWLSAALPRITDKNATFEMVLEGFKRALKDQVETRRRYYEEKGFDTGPLYINEETMETPDAQAAAGASPGGQDDLIEVYDPDTGKTQSILRSLAPEAQKRGWQVR